MVDIVLSSVMFYCKREANKVVKQEKHKVLYGNIANQVPNLQAETYFGVVV